MSASQLTQHARRRLEALVADDRPDPEVWLEGLRQLAAEEGVAAHSLTLHRLTHLHESDARAEVLLRETLQHRQQIARRLGRDPGLRVALLDYLVHVAGLLLRPTIVEADQLARIERSAITDDLTGLYNRRYAQTAVELEIRRSRRYVLPMALLMLDLDSFKVLNDRHGHPFGDRILRQVGRQIRRAVRDADLACRIGGEEFLVILPETGRPGAFAVAERIRERVTGHAGQRTPDGREEVVTLSGGIAAYPADGEDAQTLVANADKALYLAKMRGRDRIVLHHAERRAAVRYPGHPRARARLAAPDGAGPDGAIINLSCSGALVELPGGELPGDRIELAVTSPGKHSLQASGRVVRVESDAGSGRQRVAIAFQAPLDEIRLQPHVRTGYRKRPSGRSSR